MTIRNTLAGGRRTGVFTALGVSAGQAAWTFAASVGIAALLVASEPAFLALKLAGAAYLVYLGGQALWRAARPRAHRGAIPAVASGRIHLRAAFRHGLVSNLGNPKMAIFFTSLLPQFTGEDAPVVAPLVLGLVFCSLTFAWLCAYAFVVARAGALLRQSRLHRALDAISGTVLVALGARLASAER